MNKYYIYICDIKYLKDSARLPDVVNGSRGNKFKGYIELIIKKKFQFELSLNFISFQL